MYIQILINIIQSKCLNKARVARLANVSRAAVTKWFQQGAKKDQVNVETSTLNTLANSLNMEPSIFLEKRKNLSHYQTYFLWDRLYQNMEEFLAAIIDLRLPALARLTQTLGFYQAKCIAGKSIITHFPKYKKYIKPIRRKQLELLWPLYQQT